MGYFCNEICTDKKYLNQYKKQESLLDIYHKTGLKQYNYETHKRCQVCMVWIQWDGLFCPCCNYRLRTRTRSKSCKLRRLERQQEQIKNNGGHS